MSNDRHIIYERFENVVLLSLNLPNQLNALSFDLQTQLREHLAEMRGDRSVRSLVLTGMGKAFCVGADISELALCENRGQAAEIAQSLEGLNNRLIEDITSMPFPVLSAINGPCVGGGVGLALAADVSIAARSAYFYLPFMPTLGIVPDMGTTWFLERSIGRARAMGISLLNERLSAEQAALWGLIWQVVDDAELKSQAIEIAHRLASLPSHAAKEIREIYRLANRQSLMEQLRSEVQHQRELLNSPCFREGVDAFLNKRNPVFPMNRP